MTDPHALLAALARLLAPLVAAELRRARGGEPDELDLETLAALGLEPVPESSASRAA